MYTIFTIDVKILSALGACYVTITGGVLDKSSVNALINLRTLLDVPIVTVGHFSSFSRDSLDLIFKTIIKHKKPMRKFTIYSKINLECACSFIIIC